MIIPIRPRGLWNREARAYVLLSLAHDDAIKYGASLEQNSRARALWVRFIERYPQFLSPLVAARSSGGKS